MPFEIPAEVIAGLGEGRACAPMLYKNREVHLVIRVPEDEAKLYVGRMVTPYLAFLPGTKPAIRLRMEIKEADIKLLEVQITFDPSSPAHRDMLTAMTTQTKLVWHYISLDDNHRIISQYREWGIKMRTAANAMLTRADRPEGARA
jgi:hypothetical protein